MSTNVKNFRSTDAGAPTLTGAVPGSTGAAGSYINLLRKVFVDGYNSQTASSVTVSANVATFNATAHGFLTGQCLLFAGATGGPTGYANFNGEGYVVSASADSFTVATTGISDGTLTGTITAKMAPAGWTEPYAAGTNITCFRQGGGNQFYFNIDETTATYARVVGFESMTAAGVANGTNAFPTNTQVSGGLYWDKSSTNDATARDWIIAATDRHVYIHVNGNSAANASSSWVGGMGDAKTWVPADVFHTFIIGGTIASITSNNTFYSCSAVNSATSGHYFARSYTQNGTAVTAGKTRADGFSIVAATTAMSAGGVAYPYTPNGGLLLSPMRLHENAAAFIRGDMPGIWDTPHSIPVNHLDTVQSNGNLAGRSFLFLRMYSNSGLFLETSNTWDM